MSLEMIKPAAVASAEALLESILGRPRGSILDMLEARAERHGHTTFMTSWCPSEEGRWSYVEAFELVCRVAAGWRSVGVAPGDRIASYLMNTPQAIWAWFGAHGAGATFIPINRHVSGALLEDQIRRSGAKIIVTELAALTTLKELPSDLALTLVLVDGPENGPHTHLDTLKRHDPEPLVKLAPSDIGFITFTSGSTGRSKAVRLTNNSLVRGGCAYAAALKLDTQDVIFGWNPLFHWGGMMLYALGAGAEYALYPKFSASSFWKQVNESGATFVEGFPVVLDYLLKQSPSADDRNHSLRRMLIGGFDEIVWRRFSDRFRVDLVNGYGMSEAEAVILPDFEQSYEFGSCGRVAPGWRVQLRDTEGNHVEGPGSGELLIRPIVRDIMFAGYESDGEATVNAWRDLWFHTGDWFTRTETGNYFFQHRMKNRIRRRGENVSEFELSNLLSAHLAVSEVAVVGVTSDKGEEDIKVSLVAKQDGEAFDLAAYADWCRESIPRHLMPRYFELFDEIPRLASGKPDFERLREITDSVFDCEET
jgi:crotonobetaine/carnitine-CoA ligase